jgi:hypothetical protein
MRRTLAARTGHPQTIAQSQTGLQRDTGCLAWEEMTMASNTINVNTTQPADWAEFVRNAALSKGMELSVFYGIAAVDMAIVVLEMDPAITWATLSERKRGRPVHYNPKDAPAVKRKRGKPNG